MEVKIPKRTREKVHQGNEKTRHRETDRQEAERPKHLQNEGGNNASKKDTSVRFGFVHPEELVGEKNGGGYNEQRKGKVQI